MTIQATFSKASERMIIRLIGDNILFIDLQNNLMAPIEGLGFSKEGCIKEHPDLKDDPDWKQKAIQRFIDKVKSFPTEKEKMDWIINEMKEMQYKPMYLQRQGFRPTKIQ